MEKELEAIRAWLGTGSINIFGMPFAGKDTQGGILADLLNGALLGGGQILRSSVIPPEIKRELDAGNLFPTEEYQRIVLPYLSSKQFDGKPLILSSVGRWHGEEDGVLGAAKAAGHPVKVVLVLTVDEPTARARHAQAHITADRGKRADDAPEVLNNRLNEFRDKTLPVIDFYRTQGLLTEIDGTPEPPEVTKSILEQLYLRATQEVPAR